MRTVLFGLDGATYTVLDHLIAEGVMPNLARVYAQGSRALLQSTPTPVTPQAWTSMVTGRSPGYHGVHDFIRPEPGSNGVFWRVNDARDNHCETIWHYASRQGMRATILNFIGTAPPDPINGHIMPGFTSGRHLRRSSHPGDLFERLQQIPNFDVKVLGLDLDIERQALQELPPERWSEWIHHHLHREQAWFGVLDHLMTHEPSDLTAIVLDGVDKIQHLAYRFLDPNLLPENPTAWESEIIALCRAYFRQVDTFLGRILEKVGPETGGRVFIASDHGFTATHEVVYINTWLHQQGLLHWREELPQDEDNALFSDRLANLANAIDLERTKAYALLPSCNGIYLSVQPQEYASFREELIQRLYQLRGPDGGQVITEVKKREEWFPGPFEHRLPDLTLTLRDHGFISVLNGREAVVPRPQAAGTHHPHGVLLGVGDGIRAGTELGLRNILDVAPLLAHSLGLPIPQDYEGAFPFEFYSLSYLAGNPPALCDDCEPTEASPECAPAGNVRHEVGHHHVDDEMDEADQAIILDRLRSLGYIE